MNEPPQLLVAINGDIVNLTSVVDWHPGGKHILTSNRGSDVTDLFQAFHLNLNYRHLIVGKKPSSPSPYVIEFRKLNESFKAKGWYDPPIQKCYTRLFLYSCLFTFSIVCLATNCIIIGAIAMGLFWQQIAGLGHDLGHSSSLQSRKSNMMTGSLLSVVTGLSSVWWRQSHFQHHAHTNVIEEDPDILHMPIFSVSKKLFKPFYHNFIGTHVQLNKIGEFLIRVQHYTMYPILMFARLNLYAQSIKHIFNKYDMYSRIEKIGMFCFFGWHALLLAQIGAIQFWKFALLSHFVSGTLHVQIVISHWASDVKSKKEHSTDHFSHTLQSTVDVLCPKYLDWFHLGLQFQVAHHMFPRLPSCHLREATYAVQQICLKHNLVYNAMTFTHLNRHLLRHMKSVNL